jgi:hypothetical protein
MAATYGRWAVRGGSRGGGERRAEVVDGARWYETPLRGRWGGGRREQGGCNVCFCRSCSPWQAHLLKPATLMKASTGAHEAHFRRRA